MAWNSFATPLIGKAVRAASRLAHGGGSAFPGKIVERIDPQFLSRTLAQLPLGVVLVSGTNGKTATTRMVASMLQSLGLKVFTNPTGSNFTRGVVSSLLAEVSLSGKLDADIAVLELDEAYAVHFVKQVPPDYCLLRFVHVCSPPRLYKNAHCGKPREELAAWVVFGCLVSRLLIIANGFSYAGRCRRHRR